MSRVQIDAASMHSVVSAIVRHNGPEWTAWETRVLAEVTLSLLRRSKVAVPAPLKTGRDHTHYSGLVSLIYSNLDRSLVPERIVSRTRNREALLLTNAWVAANSDWLRQRFDAFKKDKSADAFIRWCVGRDWEYHLARSGALYDQGTLNNVSQVLGFSEKEKNTVRRIGRERELIKTWSAKADQSGELPPQEILDIYLLSSLIRGRYYQFIAQQESETYIWHPFRNYTLEPLRHVRSLEIRDENLVEFYLAGMICRGAMMETSEEQAVRSWADNVNRILQKTIFIEPESDHEAARQKAVSIAGRIGLSFRVPSFEKILENALTFFVMPLLGIAAGTWAAADPLAHLSAEVAKELIGKPFFENVLRGIQRRMEGSEMTLDRLAKEGSARIVAVTDEDILPSF